jgi:hypothetical protein
VPPAPPAHKVQQPAEPTTKVDQRGQRPRPASSQPHDKDPARNEEENRKSKN